MRVYNSLGNQLSAYLQHIRRRQEPEWEEELPCWCCSMVAMCGIIRNSKLQYLEQCGQLSRMMVLSSTSERGAKVVVLMETGAR
jgi:hypothetical protein